jgi:hypothetical protein
MQCKLLILSRHVGRAFQQDAEKVIRRAWPRATVVHILLICDVGRGHALPK